MYLDIPRINTARLILRGFEEYDLNAYATMMAHPDVCRFLADGHPLSRSDAWRQMAMLTGHWSLRGFGIWAVEDSSTGSLIGRVGCFQPEGWPGFEIAYTLAPIAWGKGYAREAASAALAYAVDTLGKKNIISIIRPDNTPSIRIAQRLGAQPTETIQFFNSPAIIYRYKVEDPVL